MSSIPSTLTVVHATVGFRCVVDVRGEVDLSTVGTLDAALDMVLHAAEHDIWIDLTRVTFLDSPGLDVLLRVHRALDRDYRRLLVICPPGPAARVFKLTGLDGRFGLLPDRATAQRIS